MRIQSNDSIMCVFSYNTLYECMIAGETLLGYTNVFSSNDYKKNKNKIYKYFKDKYDKRKHKPWF